MKTLSCGFRPRSIVSLSWPERANGDRYGLRPAHLIFIAKHVSRRAQSLYRRTFAQDLSGDLHRILDLVLTLVLIHELNQRGSLVPGLPLSATQNRFGQIVHAQPMHLSRQLELFGGIEAETEQAVGSFSGAVDVAGSLS